MRSVEQGFGFLTRSFAHPGGNLTGLTMATGYELAGKRLELLKDMVGGLSRVAVLSNPGNPPHIHYLRETERVGTALGLDVRAFEVRNTNDLPAAFAAMADWRADGLVTLNDGMWFSQAASGDRIGSEEQATRCISRS